MLGLHGLQFFLPSFDQKFPLSSSLHILLIDYYRYRVISSHCVPQFMSDVFVTSMIRRAVPYDSPDKTYLNSYRK
jgi:hypothetical protein